MLNMYRACGAVWATYRWINTGQIFNSSRVEAVGSKSAGLDKFGISTVADKQTRQGCIKVVGTLRKRYIWTLLDELSRSVRRMTRNSNIRFLTPQKFGSTPFPRV